MSKFYFSASTASFYIDTTLELYRRAGTLPDDLTEIPSETAIEFMSGNQPGKIVAASEQGLPEWTDAPQPAPEVIQAEATAKKARLRAAADAEITWLQDAADAGIAAEDEISLLDEWKKYRVLLMRTDTSTAPDIEWPTPPVVQAS